VHSYDVFDTCLVRVFAAPEDLLFPLAQQVLIESLGAGNFGREDVSKVVEARIAAHARARHEMGREEVVLADIYDHLPELTSWGIVPSRMLAAEIELELASVRPIVAARHRLEALRSKGSQVLFIADTCLPEDVVRQMLTSAGMAQPGDRVYLSGEAGVAKGAGDLYRFVLEQEGLAAAELSHSGSHVVGDYLAPRRLGITAELVVEAAQTRYEKAVLKSGRGEPWTRSQLAGVWRAARLGAHDEGNEWLPEVVPVVAGAVGPLFVSFVAWVLRQARRDGISRLYFVGRDGQVLHRIAQELVAAEGPELHYLYGSRQAWYLPSLTDITRPELGFLMERSQSMAPDDNLRKLHLTPREIADALERHGFPPSTWDRQLDSAEAERFWDVITDPQVVTLIKDKARAARETALAYFGQAGLLADDRWALVDIGWNLTAQRALKRVLGGAGQTHVAGYYLALGRNRSPGPESGRAVGMLVEELDYPVRFPGRTSVFDNKGLVDQVFTLADHGRTLRYRRAEGEVVPVLDQVPHDAKQVALRITIQETMVALSREVYRTGLANHSVTEMTEAGRLVMDMFLAKPTRAEARAIGWVPVIYDPNDVQTRTVPLAAPISVRTLGRIARAVAGRLASGANLTSAPFTTPTALTKDLSWGFSWLEGSAALSGPPARLAIKVFKTLTRLLSSRRNLTNALLARLPVRRRAK
jgi:FMN phosphatase YigB (HAD superfamily)